MIGNFNNIIGRFRTIRKLVLTVAQIQILKRNGTRFAHRESNGIVVGRLPVFCHDMNLRGAIDRTEIGGDGLIRPLAHRKDARYDAGTPCKGIDIVELLRIEALQRHTVDQDIRQIGVARGDTAVTDGIGLGGTALGHNQDLLLIRIRLGDDDILPGTRLIDQHRQLGAIIDGQRIVGDLRIEIDRQAGSAARRGTHHVLARCHTLYDLQARKRGIDIRCHLETNGIGSLRTRLGYDGNGTLVTVGLAEEDSLTCCTLAVGKGRQRTACAERDGIVGGSGSEVRHLDAVQKDGRKGAIARRLLHEMERIRGGLLVLLDIERDILSVAQDLYGLPLVRRIGNLGQRTRIGQRIFGSGSGKVRQSDAVDRNTEQLYLRGSLRHESKRIGVGRSRLGRDTNGCRTRLIRSGDGHLLAVLLIDRDGGACGARQRHGIGKRLFLKALQRHAVEINHIKEGVLGFLDNEDNGVSLLGTALRRDRDTLHIVLAHAEHLLHGLSLVVGDGRNGADTYGKRIGVVRLVGREAL